MMTSEPAPFAVRQPPELLAPAGDLLCARAAIENGADAVYFGLDAGFNARARATNISLDGLAKLLALLHGRGVKGYLTLNTLVFTDELSGIERLVRQVATAGVDAVLVQDLGLARLVREICPELSVHASTQMTMTSAETIRAASALGIERVVLARELSLDEIRKIHGQTRMALEAFVHGALCVAYSGQCLTSESLGGRSANRGQCAQACRLPYELVCDGRDVDLGDQQYLLSPQDLAAFDLVNELIDAGVCSLKIEGRLKTPEYVANITRHYRTAIDRAVEGRRAEFTRRDVEEMELSFSRGFSPGWLGGCDHKMLVPATSSAKRGVLLGQVCGIRGQRVAVELRAQIKRGDGVVFAGNRAEGQEQGGRVYEVFSGKQSLIEPIASGTVDLTFAHGAIDFSQLSVGQAIWKNDDPELNARLRSSFTGEKPLRRVPVNLDIRAAVGEPLVVRARAAGAEDVIRSSEPLDEARKHPITRELLCEQFGRLGGTNYVLGEVGAEIVGNPMIPLSVLGRLRHELVRQLDAHLIAPRERKLAEESPLSSARQEIARQIGLAPVSGEPRLHVLCRSLVQFEHVLAENVRNVLVDFQDIRQYREAAARARESGAALFIATPRIQKPDEMGILRVLARHGAAGILVRNLAGLAFCREQSIPAVADFSLNATNELTVEWLMNTGARRVTASYDMNRDQLLDLVSAVPAQWLEVVVHQHMPMFHMEHCVFCAVLSPGTNKHNCGRPCDVHEVRLRDRVGQEHPLTADVGCRNTLFNAVPQSGAEAVPELIRRGVRNFRIELLHDAPREEIARTIGFYRRLLLGEVTGREVYGALQALNRVGVTRGTLEERRNPLAII
jgi:putative protease